MSIFRRFCALALVAALSSLTSCSSESEALVKEPKTPEDVARAVVDSINDGDVDRFLSLLTAAARKGLESGSGLSIADKKIEDATIDTATVTDDKARVHVRGKEDGKDVEAILAMKREEGKWLVYAVELSGPDGKMSVNFETFGPLIEGISEAISSELKAAFEEAARGGSQAEIARKRALFDSIAPMGEDAFGSQWRNDVDFSGKTAADALRQLAGKAGLTLQPVDHEDALSRPVDVDVRGVSRLQAIETIANEVGLYPVWPSVRGMTLKAHGARTKQLEEAVSQLATGSEGASDRATTSGAAAAPVTALRLAKAPRPWPIVYSGPFVISIDGVEQRVPHATGTVTVGVRTFGVSESLLTLLHDFGETITIGNVASAAGQSLKAQDSVRYCGGGIVSGTSFESTTSIELKHLLRAVETIDLLDGVQRFVLPTAIETVEWTKLEKNAEKRIGDLVVRLRDVGQFTEFDVEGPEATIKTLATRFGAQDAAGNELGILGENASPWQPKTAKVTLQTHVVPAKITMKLITARKVFEYPFELRATPLMQYAEMPEKHEELAFEGHAAPVDAEFQRFKERGENMSHAFVRVTNHSNKDAMTVGTRFFYLDNTGTELKDFSSTLSGAFSASGHQPVVTKGAAERIEATAFFMPPNTESIRIVVDRVAFVDETVWEREAGK